MHSDPDMAKLSFEAVRQRIKKTLRRFKESNRELLRHVDKGTLKEAEQFLCHPLSFGSRFKYWPPQRPPAR